MIPSLVALHCHRNAIDAPLTRRAAAIMRGRLLEDLDILDYMLRAYATPPFLFPEFGTALALCGTSATMRELCFTARWKPLCRDMGWKDPNGPEDALRMIELYRYLWEYTKGAPSKDFTIALNVTSKPSGLCFALVQLDFPIVTRMHNFHTHFPRVKLRNMAEKLLGASPFSYDKQTRQFKYHLVSSLFPETLLGVPQKRSVLTTLSYTFTHAILEAQRIREATTGG
jgi:hypothetical protein